MRVDPRRGVERGAGGADEVVDDPQVRLASDGQIRLEQQVVVAVDGPCQAVFDRYDAAVGLSPRNGCERLLEGRARYGRQLIACQPPPRALAEGARLALVAHPN